jgi:hypothetical protein
MGRGDSTVDARRHVVQRGEDALLLEIRKELAYVVSQPLNLGMLRLADPEHTEVHTDVVVRKHASHFAADDHVRTIGNRQGPIDAIMIGDRDQIPKRPRIQAI